MFSVGVRDLLDSVLRAGNLDNSFFSNARAVEGTNMHQKIQLNSGTHYQAEVPLSHIFIYENDTMELEVKGKADGIFESAEGITIDEIKVLFSDTRKIEKDSFPSHWNQAKCYAFIYASREKLEQICVQLTYFFPERNKTKRFKEVFSIEELTQFMMPIVEKYKERLTVRMEWKKERDASIKTFVFPYKSYNKGQRLFAVEVFQAIRHRKMLFAQAPTGIGKTLASIFPAVKAMGEGFGEKIFYLTSKTSTQRVVENTFDQLRENGLKFKVLVITAKDKICCKETVLCDPSYCEYANGHYDRVDSALQVLIKEENVNRSRIEEIARFFQVCPFELSLDVSLFSDAVICDYNYAFDPRVYLKRFFLKKGEYIFLVDEAHNLVDRSREMFSAELFSKDVVSIKKVFKPIDADVYSSLSKTGSALQKIKKTLTATEQENLVQQELSESLISYLQDFLKSAEKWLEKNNRSPFSKQLIEFYFLANAFVKTSELFDEKFVSYYQNSEEGFKAKIFCLDPSTLLSEFSKKGRATVFFSATLLPLDYFLKLFGGDDTSKKLIIPSPFPKENLCLLVESTISTKYRDRESTYLRVVEIIEKLVYSKKGNFLIFFPSHQYLQQVYSIFKEKNPEVELLVQTQNMLGKEREEFIERFSIVREQSMAAFAVMGGIFGEGIDLKGEKLSGAIIVGVGFPPICLEREIIKEFFKKSVGSGFEYAYIFPGMIKVMQAAGRVIRTTEDFGVVILLDERFEEQRYKGLFPAEWAHAKRITPMNIESVLKEFWEKHPLY